MRVAGLEHALRSQYIYTVVHIQVHPCIDTIHCRGSVRGGGGKGGLRSGVAEA